MPSIDVAKWKRTAVPQPHDKPWCYAAVLVSISRFLTDTLVSLEDFVELAFGDRSSLRMPTWSDYDSIATKLTVEGIAYSRPRVGGRRLKFALDRENFFRAEGEMAPAVSPFILGELRAGRPLICTIQGGAHDVVIIGADVDGASAITVIHYWNPSDNGIGAMTMGGFLSFDPISVMSVSLSPSMEIIDFVPATRMYRLQMRESPGRAPAPHRGSLNRSPQPITVTILMMQRTVLATHWAWESEKAIRVEAATDLVDLHSRYGKPGLLVAFRNPDFSIEASDVVAV